MRKTKEELANKPKCGSCGRYELRYRKDGTYFCRSCSYDSQTGKRVSDAKTGHQKSEEASP